MRPGICYNEQVISGKLHSWHGCRKKILKLDLMPGALVHAKYQRYPPWPAKVNVKMELIEW